MSVRVRIGDFVLIKENIIDKHIQEALLKGQKKIAFRWESYRNLRFRIVGVDTDNLIVLSDANNTELHISGKHLVISE